MVFVLSILYHIPLPVSCIKCEETPYFRAFAGVVWRFAVWAVFAKLVFYPLSFAHEFWSVLFSAADFFVVSVWRAVDFKYLHRIRLL